MFSVGRYDPRTADKTAVSSKSSSYPRSSKGKTQKDKNHKRSKNNSKHGMGKAKTKQAEKKSGKGDDVPRIRTASKISARHTNIGNEIKDGTGNINHKSSLENCRHGTKNSKEEDSENLALSNGKLSQDEAAKETKVVKRKSRWGPRISTLNIGFVGKDPNTSNASEIENYCVQIEDITSTT
mmetsp:Transcript_11338/g.16012  ORF Transcript_11338/g.16012 Transcript_11338/m.16012 type:complete len:182 (+) Transcript_11338:51-596(+)